MVRCQRCRLYHPSAAFCSRTARASRYDDTGSLTDVAGLRVGCFTYSRRLMGCTVVMIKDGTVGGVDVRGSIQGTRETDLLQPSNVVEKVQAVMLSGGSAFLLDAATGITRWIKERRIGHDVGGTHVAIVPAVII